MHVNDQYRCVWWGDNHFCGFHINNPSCSMEGARFEEIDISLDNVPVCQDESDHWRSVFLHQVHTRFNTTNGPLRRLLFTPNACSTHQELNENSSQPTGLHYGSKGINISERISTIKPNKDDSEEFMHCCTLVLGFHHCIVDGEAVMHFLAWWVYRRVGRFVSQCLSPWKKNTPSTNHWLNACRGCLDTSGFNGKQITGASLSPHRAHQLVGTLPSRRWILLIPSTEPLVYLPWLQLPKQLRGS